MVPWSWGFLVTDRQAWAFVTPKPISRLTLGFSNWLRRRDLWSETSVGAYTQELKNSVHVPCLLLFCIISLLNSQTYSLHMHGSNGTSQIIMRKTPVEKMIASHFFRNQLTVPVTKVKWTFMIRHNNVFQLLERAQPTPLLRYTRM